MKNLKSLLGKVRNRIFRVGVELEGLWRVPVQGPLGEIGKYVQDGSVTFSDAEIRACALLPGPPFSNIFRGELQGPPIPVDALEAWLERVYPSKVNATCGLHVHMSFKLDANHNNRYALTTDKEYHNAVIEGFKEWGKREAIPIKHTFWSRVRGENRFCLHEHWPVLQMNSKRKDYNHDRPGHRYTAINYCLMQHGTVECRLLPMFDTWQVSFSAITELINLTNAYLVAASRRLKPVQVSIPLDVVGTPIEIESFV